MADFTEADLQPYHVHEQWHDFDVYSKDGKYRAIITYDSESRSFGNSFTYLNEDGSEELDQGDVPQSFIEQVNAFRIALIKNYKPKE